MVQASGSLSQVLCSADMGSLCLRISGYYQIGVLVGKNIIIMCQYSLSMRHKSNGLVHRTVKQFSFVLCSAYN